MNSAGTARHGRSGNPAWAYICTVGANTKSQDLRRSWALVHQKEQDVQKTRGIFEVSDVIALLGTWDHDGTSRGHYSTCFHLTKGLFSDNFSTTHRHLLGQPHKTSYSPLGGQATEKPE